MKNIKSILLITTTFLLAGCNNIITNNVTPIDDGGLTVKNHLATQSLNSLVSLDSLGYGSNIALRAKHFTENHHDDKRGISEENKKNIESILPTLNVILESEENFTSTIYESDKEGYDYKQVVTLNVLNEGALSYSLYYNLAIEDKDEEVEDLPENPEDIVIPPSEGDNDTETTPEDENPLEGDVKEKHHDDDKHHDHDGKFDHFHRDEHDVKHSITVFGGICVVEENEYPFIAKSSEEIEDDEVEKKFALKIFTGDHKHSIKIVHEVEEDENYEESYAYEIKEGRRNIKVFAFEYEKENDDEDLFIKLSLNGERFSFKVYDLEGETYIRVKYDKKHEDHGKLLYKKVVNTLEDGTREVFFEEVI